MRPANLSPRGTGVDSQAANGITALIAAGAAVDRPDILGWTPLMWAARRGDDGLVAQLLAAGADVNAIDRDGETVLDHAAGHGYPSGLAALLRAHGALPAALCFEAPRAQNPDLAWRFYRRVFADQDRLKEGEPFLRRLAADLGADLARLDAALASPALRQRIAADIGEADSFGFDGVPVFIVNGRPLEGSQSPEDFAAVIDALLTEKRRR